MTQRHGDAERVNERLVEWAGMLRTAPRCGATVDAPEGARYVVLSETLADRFAAALEEDGRALLAWTGQEAYPT